MNPLYGQMFNPQYVNPEYLRQQQIQQLHDYEQRQEIMKAVNAIHDYCEAVSKISPQYQQVAFFACATAVLEEMGKRGNTMG